MIRIILPQHLRTLARIDGEATLEIDGPVTSRAILDALESRYLALQGTIRDHVTKQRRPMIRFFVCQEDVSHDSPDALLPDAIARGQEAFWIVGAIAGGSAAGWHVN